MLDSIGSATIAESAKGAECYSQGQVLSEASTAPLEVAQVFPPSSEGAVTSPEGLSRLQRSAIFLLTWSRGDVPRFAHHLPLAITFRAGGAPNPSDRLTRWDSKINRG